MDNTNNTLTAPKTLQEWRSQKLYPPEGYELEPRPRNAWIPLESFFLSHGYILWQPSYSMYPMPPNDEPRAPDGFAYRTEYCEIEPNVKHFNLIVSHTSHICFSGLTPTYSRALFIVQRARLTIAMS